MRVIRIKQALLWLGPVMFFLISFTLGCNRQEETPIKVSLSDTEQATIVQDNDKTGGDATLRIAISAIISPKETFVFYKELLDYISRKLGVQITLIQRQTYEEVNNLVKDQALDLAFVCSGAYVDGHDRFGMELLVAPVVNGKPVYFGYIIVPQTSSAASLADLRGKRFAFTDPMSNTGRFVIINMLRKMNENADSFFSESIFTYSHNRSIDLVAHSLVDGAAVDGLIWEYMNSTDPSLTSQTKIISKSQPFGIPPIVTPPALNSELKIKIRNLFLTMHMEEEGRKLLEKLHIDKFIVPDDSQYDSIRKMQTVDPEM